MNEELMEGHSFKEIYYVSVRTAKELPPLSQLCYRSSNLDMRTPKGKSSLSPQFPV